MGQGGRVTERTNKSCMGRHQLNMRKWPTFVPGHAVGGLLITHIHWLNPSCLWKGCKAGCDDCRRQTVIVWNANVTCPFFCRFVSKATHLNIILEQFAFVNRWMTTVCITSLMWVKKTRYGGFNSEFPCKINKYNNLNATACKNSCHYSGYFSGIVCVFFRAHHFNPLFFLPWGFTQNTCLIIYI